MHAWRDLSLGEKIGAVGAVVTLIGILVTIGWFPFGSNSNSNSGPSTALAGLGVPDGVNTGPAAARGSGGGYFPARQPFDYSEPCNAEDQRIYDRCGSLTGPVFNSFINTPSYGDERAFFDARRSDQTESESYANTLSGIDEGSQEVVLRMYVHNNASQDTNADNEGIARNTRVRISIPTETGSDLQAIGYISSSNSTPSVVEDTVALSASQTFQVEYIPGTAVIYSNGDINGSPLSDEIVGEGGVRIGYDKLDGQLPGSFEYEAVIQASVQVVTG